MEDLVALLGHVKERHPDVQAVSSGAIASDYQRLRVENVSRPEHCRNHLHAPVYMLVGFTTRSSCVGWRSNALPSLSTQHCIIEASVNCPRGGPQCSAGLPPRHTRPAHPA